MHGRGFTLIELLVVVAILSATAVAAFNFAAEDRAQIRIDDTVNRLKILRRSVLGANGPVYDGEQRLAGYVVDNGVLPGSLVELLSTPTDYQERGSVVPYYSTTLNSSCVQGTTTTSLSGNAATLIKGHAGSYLRGLAADGSFRDGWGNQSLSDDDSNFGWSVDTTTATNVLTIASLGADNASGGDTTASADRSTEIVAADWLVSLAGWHVTLRNYTTAEITASSMKVALLVFENTTSGGQWRRFTASDNSCTTALAQGDSCTFTFGATSTCSSSSVANQVPIGRHLLLLLDSSNGAYGTGESDTTGITAQAAFYPGASLPAATLEIR
jgi:prepilin-type N-terminal cleavage/methylation domain-containing protein